MTLRNFTRREFVGGSVAGIRGLLFLFTFVGALVACSSQTPMSEKPKTDNVFKSKS